jgi:pyruvate formate lyase activating enzyme
MLYPEFLSELFGLCRGVGLGCLIDSNGTVDFAEHQDLLALSDGVMLDLKCWDDSWFVSLTGTDGKTVRKNLAFLAEQDKLAELRVIVTVDRNDPEAAVRGAAGVLGERVASTRLRLMRFRHFGVRGEMEGAPSPTDERMDAMEELARSLGFGTVVVS